MASHWPDSANTRLNIQEDLSPGPAQRQLSRSPHPYRRRKAGPSRRNEQPDIGGDHGDFTVPTPSPYPSDRGSGDEAARSRYDQLLRRAFRSPSDSGTEADDESYTILKGLPAPPVKLRKGLRDTRGEGIERSLTPPYLKEDGIRDLSDRKEGPGADRFDLAGDEAKQAAERAQRMRRSEFIRRGLEFGLVAFIGGLLLRGGNAVQAFKSWHRGKKLVNAWCRRNASG
jgi:hypothetical protein